MKNKPVTTRKLGKLFYILLLVLTAAMLTMLGVWTATGNDLYLYILIGLVPLYVVHLVYHLARTDKDYKKRDAERSEFLAVARDINASVVYMTYLGDEKRIAKPSESKKDYLVEFYSSAVNVELLKRHLWYDLSDADEESLLRYRIGRFEVPYPFLSEISGRKLLVQAAFGNLARNLPAFRDLFGGNEVVLYDE